MMLHLHRFLKSVTLLLIGVVPFFWPSPNIENKVRGLSSPLMDGTLGHYRHFSCVHSVFPEVSEWLLHMSKGPRVNFYLCDRFLVFVYFN